ncbi:MAG: DUF642 domain-containing protein [Armatimonadota bacterium]
MRSSLALFTLAMLLAAGLLSGCSVNGLVTPTIINGGFEANLGGSDVTALTGWTVESGAVDIVTTLTWAPHSGVNSLDLNATSEGVIYQDVLTAPGTTYRLSFYLAGNMLAAPVTKTLAVYANSTLLGTPTFSTSGHTVDNPGWTYYQYTFTADTAATRIKFDSDTLGSAGPALDDISLMVAP